MQPGQVNIMTPLLLVPPPLLDAPLLPLVPPPVDAPLAVPTSWDDPSSPPELAPASFDPAGCPPPLLLPHAYAARLAAVTSVKRTIGRFGEFTSASFPEEVYPK
jgi:hypothetical protein